MVFERTCERCMGARLTDIDVQCDLCGGKGTVELRRCARSQCDEESRGAVTALAHYLSGHLPCPGGWGDQPAVLLDAIEVAMGEKNELDEARAEG